VSPVKAVGVRVESESLTVDVPENSELLSGSHRIYFLNVLGLEPGIDSSGYILNRAAPADLVAGIVEYLRQQEVVVELNPRAEIAIAALENASYELAQAKTAGTIAKSKPQSRIAVPGLKRPLKSYQIPAVAHAISVGNAANFSVPGSGKTTIALSVFAILKNRKQARKMVVIGPRASFVPWEEEYRACFGKRPNSIRITGARPRRMKLYREARTAELVLMTYQMANNDQERLKGFLQDEDSFVVLDESHNIKRLEGGSWAPALIEVGAYAARRMILSGTPAPNSATDLWSQITFLWPNPPVLGSRDQFKTQAKRDDFEALNEIREQVYPFYWRIRKKDLRLPTPKFRPIKLELRPYQQAIYRVLAAKVLADVVKAPTERAKLRMWRTARMVRLLQTASNPALLTQYSVEFQVPPITAAGLPVDELIREYHRFETPVKIDFSVKLAKELLKKKQKVLIWTAFVHNIRTLQKALRDFQPRIIYGDVPKDEEEDVEFNREKMIHQFRTSSEYPLLIANPSACAESVSLHRICNHAIYLDRTFNAAHYLQSLDRIHRIGMEPGQKVYYYLLQSKGTIDEVIHERLLEKEKRMRTLRDDDISVMNLDYSASEFSEETEEDRDFSAVIDQLQRNQAIA
jgi:SNF2 family DNA or RNA helicase